MLIQLLDYLQNGKTYSIQDLADLLHKDIDSVRVELEYLENQGYIRKVTSQPNLNSTPFVRQYDILSNKWGVLLCQKEYQTNDIRQNSKNW